MKRIVLVMAVLFLFGFVQQSPAATWSIEKVTDNTEPDVYPFITTDAQGVHVVYAHNDGDLEVFYATNATGPWQSSRVTDNTHFDLGLDIAAKFGDIHIALMWEDSPDDEISYCKGKPGTWVIERVTDDSDDDGWPSMAIDNSGFAHIAYYKVTGGHPQIFYANNVIGSWQSEQVTNDPVDNAYPSMMLDSEGNPNIVYIMFTGGSSVLFYTKKVAGVWITPQYITSAVWLGSYPFLVLDNANFAHVVYSKDEGPGTDLEIYYANNATGSWQESKVTTNDFPDYYPSLFIDPHKKAHIAYMAQEPGDGEIFYANNVAGIWSIGRVTDNSANDMAIFGRYIVADNQGFGHIVFWNDQTGNEEVYHARSNDPLFVGIEEANLATSSPVAIGVYPNPFSAFSTICYSLASSGTVALKVYDISGSLIRTLVSGFKDKGTHQVVWDGRSDAGTKVSTGVYFYRLTAGELSISAKTIVK